MINNNLYYCLLGIFPTAREEEIEDFISGINGGERVVAVLF